MITPEEHRELFSPFFENIDKMYNSKEYKDLLDYYAKPFVNNDTQDQVMFQLNTTTMNTAQFLDYIKVVNLKSSILTKYLNNFFTHNKLKFQVFSNSEFVNSIEVVNWTPNPSWAPSVLKNIFLENVSTKFTEDDYDKLNRYRIISNSRAYFLLDRINIKREEIWMYLEDITKQNLFYVLHNPNTVTVKNYEIVGTMDDGKEISIMKGKILE